jgi:hypothetical protein
MYLPCPPQYIFVNSAPWLGSPSLNASLSIRTCKELIVFTKDAHTKGAQQNAYANTAKALTTPFKYQGQAMTKSADDPKPCCEDTKWVEEEDVNHNGRKSVRTKQVQRPAKQGVDCS